MRNKKYSKDEIFIVNAISRKQIAIDLNRHIKKANQKFKHDDPRLTKKICDQFALGLAQSEGETADETEALVEFFQYVFLQQKFKEIELKAQPG